MRRSTPILMALVLTTAGCGSESESSVQPATSPPASTQETTVAPTVAPTDAPTTVPDVGLDLAGAAAGAQRAIDQGDMLGDCPFDQQAVVDAIRDLVPLVPEFTSLGLTNGQVFYGGEVDITYCGIDPAQSTTATDGIEELRIDVHPGVADLQQYLDEEWGGDTADASPATDLLGGALRSWCLEDDQCIAAWQGDGLFVALVVEGVATATASDAAAALEAALPIVIAELAA